MFAVFASFRKQWALLMLPLMMFVSACQVPSLGGSSGPSINTNAPVPVALLVPYGSADANEGKLAKDLENAARLAASDLSGVQIDLRVYPTGGNAQKAQQSALQAVDEGAKIIIGPLHAEAANAVSLAVAKSGVNVLAFSNNTAIAGGNLFILGQTFQSTARRLVSHAASQGKGQIMVVHANTVAGKAGRDAIIQAISATAATPAGVVGYDFSQQGVVSSVPAIRNAMSQNGANAIFFTANAAGGLPLFSQMLPEAGVTPEKAQFMGLARWDTPPQTLELPGVQGGWFALPDPQRNAQFNNRYQAAYGSSPHALAGLAYDGVAAVGALVRSGNRGALTKASLTQPDGFQGVNGVFRLLGDGTNQRALAVATIENKTVKIVSPAPTNFRAAGF